MPQSGRNPAAEFEIAHIPGAVFFDIDAIADTSSPLPHMVATPDDFAAHAGALGISRDHTIVVYDGSGLFSAARAWWNFRIMGAEDVRVLAGGLPRWQAEARPIESGPALPVPAVFEPRFQADTVASADTIRQAIETGRQIVDVRSAGRFAGTEPEPRPGLACGHMPGARNLPFGSLIENGEMRAPDELQRIIAGAGIDAARPVISTCGSGVSAPLFNLALARLGIEALGVYDGSWAEWGALPGAPIVRS